MSVAEIAALSPLIIAAFGGTIGFVRWVVREILKARACKLEPPAELPKIIPGDTVTVGTWAERELQKLITAKDAELAEQDALNRRMLMSIVVYEDWRLRHAGRFGDDPPPNMSRFVPTDS